MKGLQGSGTSMPHVGHQSLSEVKEPRESEDGYPVMYVRALLKINRRTMWRYQARYNIPSYRRLHPNGSRSLVRYFLASDLRRLLSYVNTHTHTRSSRLPLP